jgi:hypothetical protein
MMFLITASNASVANRLYACYWAPSCDRRLSPTLYAVRHRAWGDLFRHDLAR